MILSTAWTTPAILAGRKMATRRDWKGKQIALARKQMESGERVDLWTKSPRFKGEPYATCRIVALVEGEDARTIPDHQWYAEGFDFLQAIGAPFSRGMTAADVWRYWRSGDDAPNLQTIVTLADVRLSDRGEALFEALYDDCLARFGRETEGLIYTLEDLRHDVAGKPGWERVMHDAAAKAGAA